MFVNIIALCNGIRRSFVGCIGLVSKLRMCGAIPPFPIYLHCLMLNYI
jgi:hypothetical protein